MTAKFSPIHLKFLISVLLALLLLQSSSAQEAQPWSQNTSPLPAPTGFVNDYAGVIDGATKQQLETKLKTLRDSSNPPIEIAVVTIETTGGRDIFDYSLAVARGWGIGSKQDDNPSALMLVAIKDRKYFTQISKDLEDELPDGLVGSIQRQYLVPEFRKGNYGKGISDTIDAYIATIQKTNLPTAAPRETPGAGRTTDAIGGGSGLFCCTAIVLILLILILSRSKGGRTKGDHDRWGGGGFGGGGGGGSALPWIIGSILASGSSSSGSSSSGDWGGSSGGWGGFGGGGDFGGGGAGGDW